MEVVLETKNLCKSFGAVMVNDKINLTLHRGEIMAVLGLYVRKLYPLSYQGLGAGLLDE